MSKLTRKVIPLDRRLNSRKVVIDFDGQNESTAFMWIFCCGMFRSASTLQFQITSRLVKEAGIGYQVGWIDWKHFQSVKQEHDDRSGLKVVKVHVCSDAIAEEFRNDNAKGIYIFRDIRDVYASYLKQREKPFEVLWNERLVETCLEAYKAWTSLPNVLVSQYDHVIENLPTEVERIAQHLGIEISPEEAEKIASDYEMERQKQRIEQLKPQIFQLASVQGDRDAVDFHDEESLLHINHIRSGKIGQWQQELSAKEVALIEQNVEKWCAHNHFPSSIFLT